MVSYSVNQLFNYYLNEKVHNNINNIMLSID